MLRWQANSARGTVFLFSKAFPPIPSIAAPVVPAMSKEASSAVKFFMGPSPGCSFDVSDREAQGPCKAILLGSLLGERVSAPWSLLPKVANAGRAPWRIREARLHCKSDRSLALHLGYDPQGQLCRLRAAVTQQS